MAIAALSPEQHTPLITVEQVTATFEQEKIERLGALIDRAGLPEELHVVAFRALGHYKEDLLYHNIEHMFRVAERTLELCEERSVDGEDKSALFIAALWHDADYHLPLVENGRFTSKEHRSATLAFDAVLEAYGTSGCDSSQESWSQKAFAGLSAALIISTEHGRDIGDDPLKAILNEADLDNVMRGSRLSILQTSGKIIIETLLLEGEAYSEETLPTLLNEGCAKTRKILSSLALTKHLSKAQEASDAITPEAVQRAMKRDESATRVSTNTAG